MSQHNHIEKVLEMFNMNNSKYVSTLLASHFKLNFEQCPTSEEDKEDMENVTYVSEICSLMYVMICT